MSGICSKHWDYDPNCNLCNADRLADYFEIEQLKYRVSELENVLKLIATPMRLDGTWNRDRHACYLLAKEALDKIN